MVLDITYIDRLVRIYPELDGDGNPADYTLDYIRAYNNPDFPGRADDVDFSAIYDRAGAVSFRAGSYSGCNQWREQLAELAGYSAVPYARWPGITEQSRHDAAAWQSSGGPFYELIYFSDCEGIIGAAVSRKLASDFAAFQEAADKHPDEWFRRKYSEWRTAFETASRGGLVLFH